MKFKKKSKTENLKKILINFENKIVDFYEKKKNKRAYSFIRKQ